MPYSTSARACSRVSAMCIGPTRRQPARSTRVPNSAARSSATSQCMASRSTSPVMVAPIDSRLRPCWPATRGPDGEAMAAIPISKHGSVNGRSWQRASTSS